MEILRQSLDAKMDLEVRRSRSDLLKWKVAAVSTPWVPSLRPLPSLLVTLSNPLSSLLSSSPEPLLFLFSV
ncbi:hypothetical protein ACFX15_029350 [Malus domestica]